MTVATKRKTYPGADAIARIDLRLDQLAHRMPSPPAAPPSASFRRTYPRRTCSVRFAQKRSIGSLPKSTRVAECSIANSRTLALD